MIPRRTAVTRGKPPRKVNRKRKASEFARCYGSKERVQWVKSLPCAVPNCDGQPIENAHALGGGAGRKADYQLIAPLCRAHHRYLHQHGTHQFAHQHGISLLALSLATDVEWRRHLATKDTP